MNPLSDGKLLADSKHWRQFRPTLLQARPKRSAAATVARQWKPSIDQRKRNALRSLPVGTAYAAWTGIGAVGTAVMGMHRRHCRRRGGVEAGIELSFLRAET
jgi:hypothetical protein